MGRAVTVVRDPHKPVVVSRIDWLVEGRGDEGYSYVLPHPDRGYYPHFRCPEGDLIRCILGYRYLETPNVILSVSEIFLRA